MAGWARLALMAVALAGTGAYAQPVSFPQRATAFADKPATLYFGRAKTYAALLAEAEALAGWLQAQGVRRGDRVALFMQNCPQFLVAYHAILRADAVVVPVNAMNKAEEFGHYIVDPGTRVVICGAELAHVVAADVDPRVRLRQISEEFLEHLDPVGAGRLARVDGCRQ